LAFIRTGYPGIGEFADVFVAERFERAVGLAL
jgi:hypothetical protein